jgi:mono/diheme cytochrome c family protein
MTDRRTAAVQRDGQGTPPPARPSKWPRVWITLGLTMALVVGAAWLITRPATLSLAAQAELGAMTGDPVAGEQVFWAAGCAACHAADGAQGAARLILSGGQRFTSPFGTFVAPNISMHPTQGIGGWTQAQFVTALRMGTSPDGRHYYPAFPYAAYRLAAPQDLVDLWAYWQGLPVSDQPSLPHDLGFPFTIRRAVGVWKWRHLRDDFVQSGDLNPDQARGRYLVEALAHCGECHTPRGALGGLDTTRWLAGAPNPSGTGTIPALTPDRLTWSTADIAAYLSDGFTPDFDSAGGSMVAVIANMAQLPETDRQAIAAYLKTVPPATDRPQP